jgi:acyl-CoA thioesterase II
VATVLDGLVELCALEKLEENLFRGQSQDLGWGTVFGGQVLGQALSAAVQTVPADRHVHSLHAYFLRPGNVSKPIIYDVDRIRDGGSFTTRRVVAIQSGQAIFNLAASFQQPEIGFEHQDDPPWAPEPTTVQTEQELFAAALAQMPAPTGDSRPLDLLRVRAMAKQPFEMRPITTQDHPFKPSKMSPARMVWLKTIDKLPDDQALHCYLLAYASDHGFLTTALQPHGVTWLSGGMQVASLDHVMWFHRQFRVDDWLLHVMDSPSASGARGLVRGRVFSRDGKLVASTAQEGLVRRRQKPAPTP